MDKAYCFLRRSMPHQDLAQTPRRENTLRRATYRRGRFGRVPLKRSCARLRLPSGSELPHFIVSQSWLPYVTPLRLRFWQPLGLVDTPTAGRGSQARWPNAKSCRCFSNAPCPVISDTCCRVSTPAPWPSPQSPTCSNEHGTKDPHEPSLAAR